MKLLCINAKTIEIILFPLKIISTGKGLKEGEIFTTKGKPYKDEDGQICYYIDGLGQRLACRFTELLDEKEETLFVKEKELCLN